MRRFHDSESIGEFKLKKYASDPVITEEGFIWYNETDKCFKCTIVDTDGVTVTTKKVVDQNILAAEGGGASFPSGGSSGDVLTSDGAGGVNWDAPSGGLPSGGSSGDILFNGESGPYWSDPPTGVPSGGSNGDILYTDGESGLLWDTPPTGVPSGGDDGDILYTDGEQFYWDSPPSVLYTVQTSTAATSHIINHSLSTDYPEVIVWVDNAGTWTMDNTSVTSITIDTSNQITVNLASSANIRVSVRSEIISGG